MTVLERSGNREVGIGTITRVAGVAKWQTRGL